MRQQQTSVRVLYSFPHRLGAGRICYTAWQQVSGLAAAGAEVTVFAASIERPVTLEVRTHSTLACGKLRVPFRLLGGDRAFALHDSIVSRKIEKLVGQFDIIHTWPLGALATLKTARRLGIPTVLERPNAHTRFAYERVKEECDRLGVALPPNHEHAYNAEKLRKEEEEYHLATRLLCPSDFVVKTFVEKGFAKTQLIRHRYGYDERAYHPNREAKLADRPFTMLFVGVCAVRKGLHYALEAWLRSPASRDGTFLIAGEFLPAYREKLAPMLSHHSIRVLGHRNDVAELMRRGDIFVLPTIEEGSALVTLEARGSGCVLLVSEAAGVDTAPTNALVHRVGDVEALTEHITMLYENRNLLEQLRMASLKAAPGFTWTAAGVKLLDVYRETIGASSGNSELKTNAEPPAGVRS